MMPSEFLRIWRFHAHPARVAEFRTAYGPDGAWAQLFRRSKGYRGTELLESVAEPGVFVTVDRWEGRGDWETFLGEWRAEVRRTRSGLCGADGGGA